MFSKTRIRRWTPLVVLPLLAVALPRPIEASGLTTHLIIGEIAVDRHLHSLELKELLNRRKKAFRTGVMHPDVTPRVEAGVNGAKEAFADHGHIIKNGSSTWPTEALKLIERSDENYEKRLAFILGVLTHAVTDHFFDYWYVGLKNGKYGIKNHCPPSSPYSKGGDAQWHTDWDLDVCINGKLSSAQQPWVPLSDMKSFCDQNGFGLGDILDDYRSDTDLSNNDGQKWLPAQDPSNVDVPGIVVSAYQALGFSSFRQDLENETQEVVRIIKNARKATDLISDQRYDGYLGDGCEFTDRDDVDSCLLSSERPDPSSQNCEWGKNHFREDGIEDSAKVAGFFIRKTYDALIDHYEASAATPMVTRETKRCLSDDPEVCNQLKNKKPQILLKQGEAIVACSNVLLDCPVVDVSFESADLGAFSNEARSASAEPVAIRAPSLWLLED